MTSLFEQERIHYLPKLPRRLELLNRLQCQEERSLAIDREVAPSFRKLGEQSSLIFQEGREQKAARLRVGVVFSGGQAPGGHNVIAGLDAALKKMHPASELIGFLNGPLGIIEGRSRPLSSQEIALFRNTGGFHLLGSGRTKIETAQQFEASLKNVQALDLAGLVIIGGDDSNTNAAFLAEYFLTKECKTAVVGVPKTIDGDLKNEWIEISFGFDTACKVYAELIGNIARDALSAKKYTHFIKLMGRSASHVTLECALQVHPNMALIAEEAKEKKWNLQDLTSMLADLIEERSEKGKNYGILLIPEGLIEFMVDMQQLIRELNQLIAHNRDPLTHLSAAAKQTWEFLPPFIQQQLMLERDAHGNVQVSLIQTEQLLIHTLQERLKKRNFRGKFSPVAHFFGYEGRSGFPSNFDANYCYALGQVAALLLQNRKTGYMATLRQLNAPVEEWEPVGVPLVPLMHLEERRGKRVPVIQKSSVALSGYPFQEFAKERGAWRIEDAFLCPGPIQYRGAAPIREAITQTLQLEKAKALFPH
jgi:diphosphate-dependent phosphofructokinase